LFSYSDGNILRYDNNLIYKEKGLRKYLAKMAHHKAIHHNKERNKKVRLREEKQARRRKFHQDQKATLAIRYAKKYDINHIVMEDLTLKDLKGVRLKKNKNLRGLNYNHVQAAIHISNMKNVVQRLCIREGIQFSLVNPRYTSKTCPICGHIHDNNRKTQEHFKCVKCGFSMNADHVAALNIALRMHVDELKNRLQYFDTGNQMYKGKGYKEREKYQEIYEEVYNNLIAKNVIDAFLVRNNMGKAC
jgi:putative transposase